MRALGFCVSVEHARFMARALHATHGIPAVAVWGDSPDDERDAGAARTWPRGGCSVVFSVDLFNEGVDVPAVDTLLMLRPTDSPTLFLQQLGRGLRQPPGKSVCTVLDFVGTHRREFRFDRRFRALLGGTRRDLERAVEQQFPFLPAGCHMELDRKAAEIVLRSLREADPVALAGEGRRAALAAARAARRRPRRVPRRVRPRARRRLRRRASAGPTSAQAAGAPVLARRPARDDRCAEPSAACCTSTTTSASTPTGASSPATTARSIDAMPERERRLAAHARRRRRRPRRSPRTPASRRRSTLLWAHPQVRVELLELLDVLDDRVDHVHAAARHAPRRAAAGPRALHAASRSSPRSASATGAKIAAWQSGVYEAKDANAELLAFTLDKSSGSFSPTTRYRDYAISRTLIHWESQSITRADSPTGLRYRNHERDGRAIMLFTRLRADDRAFWFLGPATLPRPRSASSPWPSPGSLHHPLPGDLFASFAAAVA